jgi:transcription initiation factor TFIIIB Brf1 subunit/transcription initiation factor TFIIB
MDEELRCLIEAIEKRFDSLREADREAVKVAHEDLARRLEGFPQQFATKQEATEASRALQRLEKDSLAREVYDSNHKALQEMVFKLERDKMPESVFVTFVENYRAEQENAATERRAVAAALASSTERRAGAAATWKQIAAVVGTGVGVLGLILTVVVLFANHTFG